ncbi:metal-dependent hydrolase [Candidatus Woesearchaeota archaeon]|nr:metal-dependent hydrolase [Candidatus Woesearchaeota archaeon]
MLGRHHSAITASVAALILVPLYFIYMTTQQDIYLFVLFAFFISSVIGSLTPDADCGGKSRLYYKYPYVYEFMNYVVTKPVVFLFQLVSDKKIADLEYDVKEEHRGIMHAPIGILITSTFLVIPVLLVMVFTQNFNPIILLTIWLGLLFGQMLHILEDSMTVSGINWAFPFGTKELKGKIYTYDRELDKVDIRPDVFVFIFSIPALVLFFLYALSYITYPFWMVYIVISCYIAVAWFCIYVISSSSSRLWYMDKETVKKIRATARKVGKISDAKTSRSGNTYKSKGKKRYKKKRYDY